MNINNSEMNMNNIKKVGENYLLKKEARKNVCKLNTFEEISNYIENNTEYANNIIRLLESNFSHPTNANVDELYLKIDNPVPQSYTEHLYNDFINHNQNLTEKQKNILKQKIYYLSYLDCNVWIAYKSKRQPQAQLSFYTYCVNFD